MWEKAVEELGDDDKKQIDCSGLDKGTVVSDLLVVVEERKRLCADKLWKYKKRDGEVVVLRDQLEKVIKWVNKFKEIGDVAVQYDPYHAALPWAGVRFILQVSHRNLSQFPALLTVVVIPDQMVVNDIETYGAMIEGLELVSNLITRYAMIEWLYLQEDSAGKEQLVEAVTRLYTAILVYLAKARRYYDRRTGGAS